LTNQDCIFCKIISGEIPAKLVAESTHAVAFNDIEPKQAIHVLIVPREHHANIAELAFANTEALVDLIQLGSKVAATLSTGSFRLQFNTGEAAGQSVFHVHGHIMSATPKD
jgi:histidine triad (HIT) family protein